MPTRTTMLGIATCNDAFSTSTSAAGPPFAAAMRDGAQSAFYRELAALTEAFVPSEAAAARAD
jgi:hypothetical protein